MKKNAALILAILLAGCATQAKVDPQARAQAEEPLICTTEEECTFYWQRAQFWLSNNAHFKIQTVTDTIIETYRGGDGDTSLAFKVTRERHRDGSSQLFVTAYCNNMFGCHPHPLEGIAKIKAYIRES